MKHLRALFLGLFAIASVGVLSASAQAKGYTVLSDSAGHKITCVGNACGVIEKGMLGATSGLTARVSASLSATQTSSMDLGSASFTPALSYAESFAFGTGNDQIQIIFADSGTIAASDSLTHDLAGATADAFGTTFTCGTLKTEMVTAPTTNTNDVLVGGATVAQINTGSAAGDTLAINAVRPGGLYLITAPRTGFTVTGGSRDKNRLKNSAGTSVVKFFAAYFCR